MILALTSLTILSFALTGFVLWLHESERKRWDAERRELLGRIQAPETAAALALPVEDDRKLYMNEDEEDEEYQRRVGLADFVIEDR